MGIKLFSSSSHDKSRSLIHFSDSNISETITVIKSNTLPNPDPNNYQILCFREIGKHLILMIKYLDCTNYEGKKILVFENCTIEDLKKQKLIDPHFSENKNFHSPIARFEPTDRGWKMACEMAKIKL